MAAAASSPSVFPVTVSASPFSNPASIIRLAISAVPPAANKSVATNRPPGFKSARIGVFALTRSKSSIESGTFASFAIASKCSTAFVEPPVAATPAIAFSIAVLVRIFNGVMSLRNSSINISPARSPEAAFALFVAGTLESPIGAIPKNSQTNAIVFAVNWPPQAPAPGHAAVSSACNRASLIEPRACAPMASYTS